MHLLFTCEHGGNEVPPAYAPCFEGAAAVLASHRGYDPGALALYETLRPLGAAGFYSTTSRLLVELNRSLHHPRLFSAYTRALPRAARQHLVETWYRPHRDAVEACIADWRRTGATVLHIAVHSFTPVLDGQVRQADIGLLYDPRRTAERTFACDWQAALQRQAPHLRIRRNYPYRGAADGFTTYLRRVFPQHYLGLELEVNQARVADPGVAAALVASLRSLLPAS
ncbi:MAG: N-formylglutamate amidohydrolase [Bacteroidia bacterium]